jgi:hypothetical protein
MNTAAMGMSAAGFLVVMGTLVSYLRTIPRGTVPVQVGGLVTGLSLGSVLAAAAIVWSFQGSGAAHVGVIAPAAFALMMGTFFLWVVSQRKVPAGDLQVKVGDKLLSFAATTSDGAGFSSDELAGKRTLLKFFRGGW